MRAAGGGGAGVMAVKGATMPLLLDRAVAEHHLGQESAAKADVRAAVAMAMVPAGPPHGRAVLLCADAAAAGQAGACGGVVPVAAGR